MKIKQGDTVEVLSGNDKGARGTVRTVLELAGIRNVVSKSLGSQNRTNVARATVLALASLRSAEHIAEEREVDAIVTTEAEDEVE